MDSLKIKYPDDFKKYNDKVEEVIMKNPKGNVQKEKNNG